MIKKEYGLIGFPLSHSFSQQYFTKKFEQLGLQNHFYSVFEIKNVEEFTNLVSNNNCLLGLNVTTPHKKSLIPFLTNISPEAQQIGAVNCIKIQKNKQTTGYNTDVYGFEKSLLPLLKHYHTKAIILGNGGASMAVKYVLKKLNIEFYVAARNPKPGELNLMELNQEILKTTYLIIQTTTLGMYPAVNQCPNIAYNCLTKKHVLYDIIYNPETTLCMKNAAQAGATVKNGLEMLYLQAERSWEIWNGTKE